MYRLVIADDERAACKRLELFTGKEFPDIEIVAIVNDGYELVRSVGELKPDVAIVDVNMPGMNGIEAIKMLHERKEKTRFIINTAYDEFDYVKQALDLKVDAYLLKPERKENFIETLRGVCLSIEKERRESDLRNREELLFSDMEEVLESDIIYSILMRETPGKSMSMYCELHGISFFGGAVITILPFGAEESAKEQAKHVWKEVVRRELDGLCHGIVHVTGHGINLVVIASEPQPETEDTEDWIQDLAYLVEEKLGQAFPQQYFRVGIGSFYHHLKELPKSYEESLEALYERRDGGLKKDEGKLEQWREQLEAIRYRCGAGDISGYVLEAVRHMERNYMLDIALDGVAEAINISPSYLSRLFGQELGINFVEYLTQLRIVEAARLAAGSKLSLRQIAEQTGYPNTAYLCKVFKKYTGKTIGQMRREAHGSQET